MNSPTDGHFDEEIQKDESDTLSDVGGEGDTPQRIVSPPPPRKVVARAGWRPPQARPRQVGNPPVVSGGILQWAGAAILGTGLVVGSMWLWHFTSGLKLTPSTTAEVPPDALAGEEQLLLQELEKIKISILALREKDEPDVTSVLVDWKLCREKVDSSPANTRPAVVSLKAEIHATIDRPSLESWVEASKKWQEQQREFYEAKQRADVVELDITWGNLIVGTTNEYRALASLMTACVFRIDVADLKRINSTFRSERVTVIDRGEKLYQLSNGYGQVVQTYYWTVYEYTNLKPLKAGELASSEKRLAGALDAMKRARNAHFSH